MQLMLIADLCQLCSRTKKLVTKLEYRERIIAAKHTMIMEAGDRPLTEDEEEYEMYITDYDDMIAFFKEMEIACFACSAESGVCASLNTMIQEQLVEQIRAQRDVEEEAEELGKKDGLELLQQKVVSAERLERARRRKKVKSFFNSGK